MKAHLSRRRRQSCSRVTRKLTDGSIDHSRVGLCWEIGKGKMFYFQAGHETNPVFFDANVRQIIANAVESGGPRNNGEQP